MSGLGAPEVELLDRTVAPCQGVGQSGLHLVQAGGELSFETVTGIVLRRGRCASEPEEEKKRKDSHVLDFESVKELKCRRADKQESIGFEPQNNGIHPKQSSGLLFCRKGSPLLLMYWFNNQGFVSVLDWLPTVEQG